MSNFQPEEFRLSHLSVGSAGIEPASMNKANPPTLFMTGAIRPLMLNGGLGRN